MVRILKLKLDSRKVLIKNKIDLNRILTGSEYFFIADDLSGLTALISEEPP